MDRKQKFYFARELWAVDGTQGTPTCTKIVSERAISPMQKCIDMCTESGAMRERLGPVAHQRIAAVVAHIRSAAQQG